MNRILTFAAATLLWAPANAADLMDVYQRALQNDPQLREAEATKLAAMEAKPLAIASLLPQLSGTAAVSKERESGPNFGLQHLSTGANLPFGGDGTGTTNSDQYSIDLRQSVFRWENWVALKSANAQVAQAEADYQAAQQGLIARVSQAYFDVLAAHDTLEAQEAAKAAIKRQLDQANTRFEVGLIANTDVQEAKAAYDSSVAAVIDAKRKLASTQEVLREITGQTFDSLSRPTEPLTLASPNPADEEQWVNKALEQNLQLVSSRLAADIARENVSSSRGGHVPSIDLVARGNKRNSTGSTDYTDGSVTAANSNVENRSVSLQLSVPLYSGGAVSARVRQAVYLHRASKERLERVARQTERDTRDAYLGVLSEISRVAALKQALESSVTALKATEAGYDVGTRTAVEVLDGRRQLIQAQTNYSRSKYDYILNLLKLQQAAGSLSRENLGGVNKWLQALPTTPTPMPAPSPAPAPATTPESTSAPTAAS
jgi:outer membrane protein